MVGKTDEIMDNRPLSIERGSEIEAIEDL